MARCGRPDTGGRRRIGRRCRSCFGRHRWIDWIRPVEQPVRFLINVNLTGQDLQGQNLTGVKLGGANLTGANLSGANLTGANLTNVVR
ncbi:pentapeptide repeat protein [Mycolicibacterium rhodesiae JS60]|nr:pentapeptide repeat protein [Mycolicibacterium rhodesiae JS60]